MNKYIADSEILNSLKCLYELRKDIYTYYNIVDTTHIVNNAKIFLSFEENETMKKMGEESINIISGVLVDVLLNQKIGVSVNDIGNIPSKSDIKLSSNELLEMKRIPIGTKAYSKGKPKFQNYSPDKMVIENVFDFIKDKVEEYTPRNLGQKQKADYMGFYFAVSNIDLLNSSINDLYKRAYSELNEILNVFNDVFLIFNKINLYDTNLKQNTGETVCLSLKTGKFNSLMFYTPFIVEEHIFGNVMDEYTENDIISSTKEKQIIFTISDIEGTFYIMDSSLKGACLNREMKKYCYGNLATAHYMTSLFEECKNRNIGIIGKERFSTENENIVIPYTIE